MILEMTNKMVRIGNLVKSYGKFKVLDNINLDFEKHNVIALMGPNGSGKTTLLKCILGLVIPDSGDIIINNRNTRNDYSYRQDIGYMPQVANYPENLKVRELISIVKDIRNKQEISDGELIDLFGIEKIMEKPFGQLSGGMKQRVSGAIAFLYDPGIIILDEPTAGLDPLATEIIKSKILSEREKGKLIIVTSHILAEVDEIADRLIYLLEGKIILDNNLEEIKVKTGEVRLGSAITKLIEPAL